MKYLYALPMVLFLAVINPGCSDDSEVDALLYHDGYWVSEVVVEEQGMTTTITSINDMHIDAETRRATVYAQTRSLGAVVSPPQVGPGECTEQSGSTVCFHPNAVYLNGSGQELDTADGTGAWWVKHSWIMEGEGYYNCTLMPPREDYPPCQYASGTWEEDGVSMRLDSTSSDGYFAYNIRTPVIDLSPISYEVTNYQPANTDPEAGEIDLTPTVGFAHTFTCVEEVSDFDNVARPCPE